MAKSSKTPAKETPDTVIYVGPNLSGDILISQFTVFKNGLPPYLAERTGADPVFKSLFVPLPGLTVARADLKNPGSRMARAFNTVRKGAK